MGFEQQIIVYVILAILGYLGIRRVNREEAGYQKLLQNTYQQVSSQQKIISRQQQQLRRLEEMLLRCRHDAVMCPRDHPSVEQWDTDEIRLEDL